MFVPVEKCLRTGVVCHPSSSALRDNAISLKNEAIDPVRLLGIQKRSYLCTGERQTVIDKAFVAWADTSDYRLRHINTTRSRAT